MKFLAILLLVIGSAVSAETAAEREAELDELFDNLQAAANWEEYEEKLVTAFSDSGSAAMDLLLERGRDAMIAQDFPKAIEHLSALIDHAPDFAEGWNARATAYFLMDEYGLAISDITETLARNPRHFGALTGLGMIYEEIGELDGALAAFSAAQTVHPHIDNVNEAVTRLEAELEGVEL